MTTATAPALPTARQRLPLDLIETTNDGTHWVLDAVAGSTARYEVTGSPVIVPDDVFGGALSLNGTDTAIELGRIGNIIAGSANQQAELSVTMWVKLADTVQEHKALVGVDGGWSLELDDSGVPTFAASGAAAGIPIAEIAIVRAQISQLRADFDRERVKAARLAADMERAHALVKETAALVAALQAQLNAMPSFLRVTLEPALAAARAQMDLRENNARATQAAAAGARHAVDETGAALAQATKTGGLMVTAQGAGLRPRRWTHLAAVFDGSSVTLYVDGFESARAETDGNVTPIRHRADARLVIGSRADGTARFSGQVARFGHYERALTADDILAVRAADQTAQAAFRGRYPFSFDLLDGDVRDVIYVSDVGVNTMAVTVTNTSAAELTLQRIDPATPLDANNHHLELRFRPGTFRARTRNDHPVTIARAPAGAWTTSDGPVIAADGVSSSLFLAYTGQRDRTIAAGDTLTFTLEYQSADGQLGSRGTNVVLGYRHLTWDSADHTAVDVGGERIHSIDVVNRTGKQVLPLHVGFVGSNRILNVAVPTVEASGSEGTLLVRLLNSHQPDPLQPDKNRLDMRSIRTVGSADQATKFTVSFDVNGDWALANLTQAEGVGLQWRLKRNGMAWQTADRETQGSRAVWTFNANFDNIRAGESIDLHFTGVTSTEASGLSNIYIHYEDIPGYWDGNFALAVEKSPLAFSNDRVGIARYPATDGTGDLTVDLAVAGRIRSDSPNGGLWIQQHAFVGGHSTNKVGMYNNKGWRLTVDSIGNVGIGTDSPEHRLHIQGEGGQSVDLVVNGRIRSNNNDGGLWVSTDRFLGGHSTNKVGLYNKGWRLTVDPVGNVGIGTNTPEFPVHIDAGGDAELASGGALVIGKVHGTNLAMDNNEIMARNNRHESTLHLNNNGGLVDVGPGGLRVRGSFEATGDASVNKLDIVYANPSKRWRFEYTGSGLLLSYNGTRIMHWWENGNIQQMLGRWLTPSDARLKDQIADLDEPLAIVNRLRPRRFRWKESGVADLGFIAQEVESSLPELVEDLDGTRSLSYNQFIAVAIGAIQQQQVQIDALTATLDDVKRPTR